MAIAASSWAHPGNALVGRILRFLPCLAHRALFSAVCKNWLVVTRQSLPGEQLPWLFLPSSTAAEQEACFFCLFCRTRHRAFLPDDVRGARCISAFTSPYGWLTLALQQTGGIAFHNLHTGRRYHLPEVLRTPSSVRGQRTFIHAVCGTERHEDKLAIYTAAIGAWSPSSIAFWRMRTSEDPVSCGVMLPRGSIADALYYSGHGLEGFHVLTDDEEIMVYVPGRALGNARALRMRRVTYRFPEHKVTPYAISRYLVKDGSDLFMVVRRVPPAPATFRFFRLEPRRRRPGKEDGERLASWVWTPDLYKLTNRIFVLGKCCSTSFRSYGNKLDGVYFLDDVTSYHDEAARAMEPGATRQYPCSDMGWVPIDQRNDIQRIFPTRLPSESSRAVWFFP